MIRCVVFSCMLNIQTCCWLMFLYVMKPNVGNGEFMVRRSNQKSKIKESKTLLLAVYTFSIQYKTCIYVLVKYIIMCLSSV